MTYHIRNTRLCFGIALASLTICATPAWAGDVVPPHVFVMSPTGVSISDGTFSYNEPGLTIGTLSFNSFLSYSPKNYDDSKIYYNGTPVTDFNIYVQPNYVPAVYQDVENPSPDPNETTKVMLFPVHYRPIVHAARASAAEYTQNGFQSPVTILPNSREAERGVLSYANNHYTYTDVSGAVYTFRSTSTPTATTTVHYVTSIAYPNGMVRTFSYVADRLKIVTDSSGYAVVFDRNSNGNVEAACGFDLARTYADISTSCATAPYKMTFGYTGAALSSSTNPLSQTTDYGGLSCIKPPGYTTCKVLNEYTSQHLKQTLADGAIWNFNWGTPLVRNDDYIPTTGDNEVSVVDPAGKTYYYTFTGTTPDSATDPNGNVTTYVYAGATGYEQGYFSPLPSVGGMLLEAHMPEGNVYRAEYNGFWQSISKETASAKPGSGLADQVVTYGYNYNCPVTSVPTPCSTKPISKTDQLGNVTQWSHTSFGEVEWEMLPAPTSGSARPLKLYSYVQKSAYVLNASSQLVSTNNPIWLPSSITECQTTVGSNTAACDTAAPQVTTTFAYGADGTVDNLLLRGKVVTSGGVFYRTCYGYDQWANKVSETAPRAGLTSCP